MKKITSIIFSIMIFSSIGIVYGMEYQEEWEQVYSDGITEHVHEAYDVSVDSHNNIIVTGRANGWADTLRIFTIMYGPNGDIIWKFEGPSGANNTPFSNAVDSNDNIYVTGFCFADYYISKLSNNGSLIWEKYYNIDYDMPQDIAIDSQNNIYVLGHSGGHALYDIYILKYDSNGNQIWIRNFDFGDDRAGGIAIDSFDNILIVGNTVLSGDDKAYIIKLTPSGDTIWSKFYNESPYIDHGRSVTVDSRNNIIVTLVSEEGSNLLSIILKYDPQGNILWERKYGGGWNNVYGVAVDNFNNIAVTGTGILPVNNNCEFNEANGSYVCKNEYGLFCILYDSSGNMIWGGGKSNSDGGHGVVFDNYDNIIFTGTTENQRKYVTIKYKKISSQNNLPINSIMNIINNNLEEED